MTQPPPLTLRLPPERPLHGPELQALDNRRLQPVIDTLVMGLRSYWTAQGLSEKDLARVWGLHGGLGQGKSTAVKLALQQLDGSGHATRQNTQVVEPRMHPLFWLRLFFPWGPERGCRRLLDVRWIEASKLKAEHLDARLISRLVLSPLLLWALPAAVLTLLVGGVFLWWLLSFWGQSDLVFEALQYLYWGVPVLLALPVAHSLLTWGQQEHAAGYFEYALYLLAKKLGVAPDLVVLDDLDRSSLDQQRAVLRALVRHTHWLDCPLVVCFDETDLLASDPAPEDPTELLRKLIQVPLRLTARGREDALLLAWGAAKQWHALNPTRSAWAAFLSHPIWVGHLVHILMVTESVGPRRVKHLMAEVVTSAQTWCHAHDAATQAVPLEDACGLLLLAALYQIQPLLRRDPELLVAILECGGDINQAWAGQPRGTNLQEWMTLHPREKGHLQNLVRLGNLMMPVRTGWRALVLGNRTGQAVILPPDPALAAAVPCEEIAYFLSSHGLAYPAWQRVGQCLDAIAHGGHNHLELGKTLNLLNKDVFKAVFKEDKKMIDSSKVLTLCLVWPMVQSTLPQLDARACDRLCTVLWEGWNAWTSARTGPEDLGTALKAQFLCVWLATHTLSGPLNSLDKPTANIWTVRIQSIATQTQSFIAVKQLLYSTDHAVFDRQAMWEVVLRLSQEGRISEASLVRLLVHGPLCWPPRKTEQMKNIDSIQVFRRWPVITNDSADSIKEHLLAMRDWFPTDQWNEKASVRAWVENSGFEDRPWSLEQWLQSAHFVIAVDPRQGEVNCFEILSPLFTPNASDPHWSLKHWGVFAQTVHLPTIREMGLPMLLFDSRSPLEAINHKTWPIALGLAAQGWGKNATDQDLNDVLTGFLESPQVPPIDAAFSEAAMVLWTETIRSNTALGHGLIYWGRVPLTPEQALQFLRRLLINDTTVTPAQLTQSMRPILLEWRQSWASIAQPSAQSFYEAALTDIRQMFQDLQDDFETSDFE